MLSLLLGKSKHFKEARGSAPLKIAFVCPWYGAHIVGGAEAVARDLTQYIAKTRRDVEVQVITTALKEFTASWNKNVYPEGPQMEGGIKVWRFKANRRLWRKSFDRLNRKKLMPHGTDDLWRNGIPISPLTQSEEKYYIDHMVNSSTMYRFLEKNRDAYDYFVFLPYMFGTSYHGIKIVKEKAVVIPCLHDERYAYMTLYQSMMNSVKAAVFNASAEMELAHKLYEMKGVSQICLGQMVNTNAAPGNEAQFREKFGIYDPFILYAGRKIVGKNLPLLVSYFTEMKQRYSQFNRLKLVLIGKGDLSYPIEKYPDVIDLGFISTEDKRNAYKAALALCQPSINESFSIVMMEAWLQGTPCLVHEGCEVTKDHCKKSGGGGIFRNTEEFSKWITEWIINPSTRSEMGERGFNYVLENYQPSKVIDRFVSFLYELRKSK